MQHSSTSDFRLCRKTFLENFFVALKLYCTLYCNSNFSRNGLVYCLTEVMSESNVETEENNYSVKICQKKNSKILMTIFFRLTDGKVSIIGCDGSGYSLVDKTNFSHLT